MGKVRLQQLEHFQECLKGRILERPVEGFRADLVFDTDRRGGLHDKDRRGRACGGASGGRLGGMVVVLFFVLPNIIVV